MNGSGGNGGNPKTNDDGDNNNNDGNEVGDDDNCEDRTGGYGLVASKFIIHRDDMVSIFIPIFSSNHYFLIVVNIPQKKIQFIDNLSYDKQEKGAISQLCDVLANQAPMRRVLRAKICAALVLSDRNDVRSEILDKMKAMRPSRPQL
ncbi:Ubiquitin-like-specific protease 1A [Bienertia sinuspersici]